MVRAGFLEPDPDPPGRRRHALRPLHHAHPPASQKIVQSQFGKIPGVGDAIEIQVMERQPSGVGEMQGKGRALDPMLDPQTAGEAPDQGGLPRPQIPLEEQQPAVGGNPAPGLSQAFGFPGGPALGDEMNRVDLGLRITQGRITSSMVTPPCWKEFRYRRSYS